MSVLHKNGLDSLIDYLGSGCLNYFENTLNQKHIKKNHFVEFKWNEHS